MQAYRNRQDHGYLLLFSKVPVVMLRVAERGKTCLCWSPGFSLSGSLKAELQQVQLARTLLRKIPPDEETAS